MSNNSKVKGLLKGLRFISQIFDNEKEPEIEIGHPTDVKHVAHIGWEGHHSENSPSWMNEFESVPGFSSSSLNLNGDIHSKGPDNSVKRVPEDSTRRGSRSVDCQGQEKDLAELPKSSKRQSTGNMRESQAKEKSDKPRQPKKSSKQPKDSSNVSKSTEQTMPMDMDSLQLQGSDLPPRSQSDIPKKSRSKMTKENASNVGGSRLSKSRSKAQPKYPNLNQESSTSISQSRNKQRPFEEDEQLERGSSEDILRNYSNYSN